MEGYKILDDILPKAARFIFSQRSYHTFRSFLLLASLHFAAKKEARLTHAEVDRSDISQNLAANEIKYFGRAGSQLIGTIAPKNTRT